MFVGTAIYILLGRAGSTEEIKGIFIFTERTDALRGTDHGSTFHFVQQHQ